ncbi:MAG: dethiobiotin synthase [Planctomycetaceae bacterium]|nr:dethiobiotin synthase [Planctomycetaceae bacterium]
MRIFFITGIDTDIGKSYATGLAARYLLKQGVRVVTQKMVQTGTSQSLADDLWTHRRLMGIEPLPEDVDGTTCPYRFPFPASPHLAAELENRVVDPLLITSCTERLLEAFDVVLLEGAGGIHVPITRDVLTSDYLEARKYPLIVVTSGRLGSINHTLLTLEAAVRRRIPIAGIVFNHHPPADARIGKDSLRFFREQLKRCGRGDALVELPEIRLENAPDIDFSSLFDLFAGKTNR